MRPSIISQQGYDGSMRHMWRQPLPPIDQKSVQLELVAAPNRAERPVGDQPTKRPSAMHPTN